MTDPAAPDLADRVACILRQDRGRLLAALIAGLRDFDLAEDALSDACDAALIHWRRSGLPARPEAWLLTVARRKALDRLRRRTRFAGGAAAAARLAAEEAAAAAEDPAPDIPDDRLRLIFTCCHPALEPKTRVALTLRTIAGLPTADIARAFLDRETAMAQRLSRAKAKIAAAGIPFAVPDRDQWDDRLRSVLDVIYLIFNAGYSAPDGGPDPAGARPLCDEALFLARLADRLSPGEAEIEGLLALLLLTHARAAARRGADGTAVPLEAQDTARWDAAMIDDGQAVLHRAMARRSPGPFQIKAALVALSVEGARNGATDWRQMVALYSALLRWEPRPVVSLNRAVALSRAGETSLALGALSALAEVLDDYQPFHAARADLLARAGDAAAARSAYDRAIALASDPADAAFLAKRRDGLSKP